MEILMQVIDVPIEAIDIPDWNPNEMDPVMHSRLKRSLERFGNLGVLVVRTVGDDRYETVGGAQRLAALREMRLPTVPCVVVDADDTEARLLAQALNRVVGSDDFGRRAASLRHILETVPLDEVLKLLPETAESLQALSTLTLDSLADHMRNWEVNRAARLKHVTLQLAAEQLPEIEEALKLAAKQLPPDGTNPNKRGNAFHLICMAYLHGRAQ
jgi:ParB family transcriptional regulator, chromosome partitioning protein